MLYELSLCRTKLVEVFVPGYSSLSFHILALRIVEKQESKILLLHLMLVKGRGCGWVRFVVLSIHSHEKTQ